MKRVSKGKRERERERERESVCVCVCVCVKWSRKSLSCSSLITWTKITSKRLPFLCSPYSLSRPPTGMLASCPTVMAPITCFLIPTWGIPKHRVREILALAGIKQPAQYQKGKAFADTNVITRKHFPDLPRYDGCPSVRLTPLGLLPTWDRFSCGCDVSRRKIR